jgi:hypothetical protein
MDALRATAPFDAARVAPPRLRVVDRARFVAAGCPGSLFKLRSGGMSARRVLERRREPSHAAAASPSQVAVPSSSLNGRLMGPPLRAGRPLR